VDYVGISIFTAHGVPPHPQAGMRTCPNSRRRRRKSGRRGEGKYPPRIFLAWGKEEGAERGEETLLEEKLSFFLSPLHLPFFSYLYFNILTISAVYIQHFGFFKFEF